jgi:hypothetical protein
MNRGVCILFLSLSLFGRIDAHARVEWSGSRDIHMGPGDGSTNWFPAWGWYGLDVDGSGAADFWFEQSLMLDLIVYTTGTSAVTVQNIPSWLWKPWPLPAGTEIGPTPGGESQWGTNDYILIDWESGPGGPTGVGAWAGVSNGFLGLRFQAPDGTHYGWVRMSVYAEFPGAIIHDWAYETVPDRALTTGLTIHYVSPVGHHVLPYTNWTDAATNVQAAIDAAQYGGMVLVTDATYSVTAAITLTNGVIVASVNGRDSVTIDGQQITRCFYVDHPDALLDGFTITRGSASVGGGILCSNGLVRTCIVSNNSAFNPAYWVPTFGGGIYCGPGGTISNCVISGNSQTGSGGGGGGGVFCSGGLVQNCLIQGNVSDDQGMGGGVVAVSGGIVRDSSVIGNSAGSGGGAGCAYTGTLQGCTIRSNQTTGGTLAFGGGVVSLWGSHVQDSLITENSAGTFGGGVFCWQSSPRRANARNPSIQNSESSSQ